MQTILKKCFVVLALLAINHLGMSQVNVTVNWSSNQGKVSTGKSFAINCNRYFDPAVTNNSTYISNLQFMNPKFLRFHDWAVMGWEIAGESGWMDANEEWNAAKVVQALTPFKNNFPNAEILMNIPLWPRKFMVDQSNDPNGYFGRFRNAKLDPAKYDAFATWCASLLTICKNNGINVKYWELPNEQEEQYPPSNAASQDQIADIFKRVSRKLKETDPTVKVGGLAFTNSDGGQQFLSRVGTQSFLLNGQTTYFLDFYSEHLYPAGGGSGLGDPFYGVTDQILYGDTEAVVGIGQGMTSEVNTYGGGRNIEKYLDEFAISYNDQDVAHSAYTAAVYYSLAYFKGLLNGLDAINDWNDINNGFGLQDENYVLRPRAYTLNMLTNHFIGTLVNTTSSNTGVVVHAVKTGTTKAVLLINTTASSQNVAVNFSGWSTTPSSLNTKRMRPSGVGLGGTYQTGTIGYSTVTGSYALPANSVTTLYVNDGGSNVAVTGVSVSPTSASIAVGGTQQLTATIAPANATNKTVSWSSSNTSVATVSSSGVVTGVAAGSATITVTTQDGSKTATCAVTVTATTVPVTGVTVSPTTASVNVGATTALTATVAPANATNKTLSWSSNNTSVATVSSSGVVTGVAAGSATITVTTQDGSKTATSAITVSASTLPTPVVKLQLNENTGTATTNAGSGGGTFSRTTPTPTWSTNVPAAVGGTSSVDFGTTTGNFAVESAATLSALQNLSSFTITLWVNCKSSTVGAGGNRLVSWINDGGNGADLIYNTNGSIALSVNEWPDAVTGSSTGKVTTNASAPATNWVFVAVTYSGTQVQYYFGNNTTNAALDVTRAYNMGASGATIGKLAIGHFNSLTRSAALDRMFRGLIDNVQIFNTALTASQIINVQTSSTNISVTGVTVSPTTASVNVGATTALTATVAPANATNKTVNWSSSNTSVAAVSSSGVVTGVAAGSATITVTTQDGSKTATSAITVSASTLPTPVVKLQLNENTGTATINTGSGGGTFSRTTPTPTWSTNVPAAVGGTSSVDFGTTTGNFAVESAATLSALQNLSSFTITLWVNCKSSTVGAGGNRLVSWINDGGNGADLVYNTDGSIALSVNEWPDAVTGSSTGKVTTNASAPATNWVFVAVTYSGTQVQYYFGNNTTNAALDVTRAYNMGASGATIGKLAIGHFNSLTRSGALDRMFRGLIDDVQIFNTALTASQIINVQTSSTTSGARVASSNSLESNDAFEGVEVYPNPTNGVVNLKLGHHKGVLIDVYDAVGKVLFRNKTTLPSVSIDLTGHHGIMLIKLRKNGRIMMKKVIIE